MLKSLVNIESAFSHVRWFTILLLVSHLLVALSVIGFSLRFKNRQADKIYALQGEESVMCALNQNTTENRPVEAKATIEMFHQYFFNLYPSMESIKFQMERALSMADNSAYSMYENMSLNGFYRQMVEAGIQCQYKCDSVVTDFSRYPYGAVMYGKTAIIRRSSTTIRELITSCELRNCPRSESTPNGFLIENLQVISNKDIELNTLY
ncbi:MAG: conjugative transposon protein TraK [Paludibacteraceae bacterium]|nr:conjugative transposon protein TraK [Paludibacteraceae bacterium]